MNIFGNEAGSVFPWKKEKHSTRATQRSEGADAFFKTARAPSGTVKFISGAITFGYNFRYTYI
ncbi:hypothetical protein DW082_06285 [Alistipes sp. AF48-12]|nr:hypothetical protein DW082_06285 [Alistipes sp. AF48-12]